MKFWEAMKYLEDGKKLRKTNWFPNDYIYIDEKSGRVVDSNKSIYFVGYSRDPEKDLWELYRERAKEYTFDQILTHPGKTFKRRVWATSVTFFVSYSYDGYFRTHTYAASYNGKGFCLTLEDILSVDWVEVE